MLAYSTEVSKKKNLEVFLLKKYFSDRKVCIMRVKAAYWKWYVMVEAILSF